MYISLQRIIFCFISLMLVIRTCFKWLCLEGVSYNQICYNELFLCPITSMFQWFLSIVSRSSSSSGSSSSSTGSRSSRSSSSSSSGSSSRSSSPRKRRSYSPRRRGRNDSRRARRRSPVVRRRRTPSRSRSPVGRAQPRKSRSKSPELTKIVVSRLTRNVTKDHVEEIFSTYGVIRTVELPIDRITELPKAHAYVDYKSAGSASDAIKYMDGGEIDGQEVTVNAVIPVKPLRGPGFRDNSPPRRRRSISPPRRRWSPRRRSRSPYRRRTPPRRYRSPPRRKSRSLSRSPKRRSPRRRYSSSSSSN